MRVLLLGDSHTVGGYGQTLETLFRNAGHDVTRVGVTGAAAYHYNTGKHTKITGKWVQRVGNFEDAKGKSYDLAIVSLGTNDVTGWPVSTAAADIAKLIGSLNATTKVWVGAPSFSDNAARTYNKDFAKRDLNTRAADLWNALSVNYGAYALDPRAATVAFVQPKDIHFKPEGGTAWAQFVFANVPVSSSAVATTSTSASTTTGSRSTGTSSPSATPSRMPVILIAAAIGIAAVVLWPKEKFANG